MGEISLVRFARHLLIKCVQVLPNHNPGQLPSLAVDIYDSRVCQFVFECVWIAIRGIKGPPPSKRAVSLSAADTDTGPELLWQSAVRGSIFTRTAHPAARQPIDRPSLTSVQNAPEPGCFKAAQHPP